MGCSRSGVSSTARVAVSTCSRTRLMRRSHLTATRKSSSGDGHFRVRAAAYQSPDPLAISAHRTVRYCCDDSRSFGGDGTSRVDERSAPAPPLPSPPPNPTVPRFPPPKHLHVCLTPYTSLRIM